MSSRQIMVVGAECDATRDIETSLTRLGYGALQIARSGEQALEQAASARPDLALVHLGLWGDIDGIETAGRLRARFGIPVTYFGGGDSDQATLARAEATEPCGYLVEPVREHQLRGVIRAALRHDDLEKEVAERQRWRVIILGAIGDGIIVTDSEGCVRFMSRVAESLTGHSAAVDLGKPLGSVFRTAPLTREATGGLWEAQGPRKAGDPEELALYPAGGEVCPIEVTAATARDEAGDIAGFVWAFRDITGRKRAEQGLREREEYFRSVIEQVSDVITVVDRDGTLYYASPSLEQVLGYNPADVLGRSVLDVLDPDDSRRTVLTLSRVVSDPQRTAWLQVRVRHHNGSWRSMEAVARQRAGRTGETRIVISSRDVTDREEAEARFREESATSTAIAWASQQMIEVLGTRDLLEHLCRIAANVLRCDFSHIWLFDERAQTYVAVAGHGDTPEQREAMHALRLPVEVGGDLSERIARDGIVEFVAGATKDTLPDSIPSRYGVTSAVFMALRRGGEMVGIHTAGYRGRAEPFSSQRRKVARRIAQLASLALEYRRLVEELNTTSQLKSDLMATLSHELRTPLGTIVGVSELLLANEFGEVTAEQSERLRVIDRTARQMLELIQSTLDVGRTERRQIRVEVGEIRVEEFISEIERECAVFPKASGVELTWDVEEELPPLHTDRVKLKVVIKNLIGNALKFTREGSVKVTVRRRESGIEFSVSDTGVGIAPETLETIFEPYRQAGEPQRHAQEGIGLGLYIVRQLLNILEGNVALESELGEGSTFRVWIPLEVHG